MGGGENLINGDGVTSPHVVAPSARANRPQAKLQAQKVEPLPPHTMFTLYIQARSGVQVSLTSAKFHGSGQLVRDLCVLTS